MVHSEPWLRNSQEKGDNEHVLQSYITPLWSNG